MHVAATTLFLVLLCTTFRNANSFDGFGDEGVLGKIKSGFQIAGKMLGLDRASGVAQLVTEAFGRTHRKGDAGEHGGTIFSGFLRILGFDTKRIGAIAVNAIIFVAQLISTSLAKDPPAYLNGRGLEGTPVDWMMEIPEIQKLLSHAKEKNLPHEIIEFLKAGKNADNTGCLQLLICKTAPFIWGMQKAVNAEGSEIKKGKQALTYYLPSAEDVADNGDECELKYPHCAIQY